MNIILKTVACVVALSLTISPVLAKGGKGGGRGGKSSYKIKPTASYKVKPSTKTAEQTDKRPQVNYRFGNGGSSGSNSSEPCRHHGGVSHCNAQGKYVCKDNTISTSNKVCK